MLGVVGGAAGGPLDPEAPGPSILAVVGSLMTPPGVAAVRAARSSCLPLVRVAAAAGCSAAATADMLRMLHRSGGCTNAIVGALREPFEPSSRLVVAAAGVLRRRRGSGLLAPRAALPWESPDSAPTVTSLTFLGDPLCPPPQRRVSGVQSRRSAVRSGHVAWAERTKVLPQAQPEYATRCGRSRRGDAASRSQHSWPAPPRIRIRCRRLSGTGLTRQRRSAAQTTAHREAPRAGRAGAGSGCPRRGL